MTSAEPFSTIRRLTFALSVVAGIASCSGGGEPGTPAMDDGSAGTLTQALAVADCEQRAAACGQTATGLLGSLACTLGLEECLASSVLDGSGPNGVVTGCTDDAEQCLRGAVSALDVGQCRALFDGCAQEVFDKARDLIRAELDVVRGTIGTTVGAAQGVLGIVPGAPGQIGTALGACEASVDACLQNALSSADIAACRADLDPCLNEVVALVDTALPAGNARDIIAATEDCRAPARACLSGAVQSLDIAGCRDLFSGCTDAVGAVVDETVLNLDGVLDTLDRALPLPIAVTLPPDLGSCSATLVQCIGTKSAFGCASEARACLRN